MNELQSNTKKCNEVIQTATNNAIKCSCGKSEGLSHKICKFWLANYCWEHNLSFATEVVFTNNQRADFLIKEWAVAIEVLSSEKYSDFIKKTYPIKTIPISAKFMSPEDITKLMRDLHNTNGKEADYYIKNYKAVFEE